MTLTEPGDEEMDDGWKPRCRNDDEFDELMAMAAAECVALGHKHSPRSPKCVYGLVAAEEKWDAGIHSRAMDRDFGAP